MKTVHIYGTAPNLANAPPPLEGVEVWACNNPKGYNRRRVKTLQEWTRWINMHSLRHMKGAYPKGYSYYRAEAKNGREVMLQEIQPDIQGCLAFPREALQERFKTSDKPQRYFTCSVSWFIALAIHEGFERIGLYGFELRLSKPRYAIERPCFFYWLEQARLAGIEVILPPELDMSKDTEPGNPNLYDGPLYGFETT
jgi:hypothetical protein